MRTSDVTQQFIVIVRTGRDLIAQMVAVDTDPGVATPIESWAHVAVTPCLVFVVGAVVDPVTTYVDGQAVAMWTLKVCFWTPGVGNTVSCHE